MVLSRMREVSVLQFEPAGGDRTEASPNRSCRLENFLYKLSRFGIALRSYCAGVLNFHFTSSLFPLAYQHVNALQNVHRFKATDYTRLTIYICHPLIGFGADDRGYVSRAEKAIDMNLSRTEKRFQCRRK